MRRLLEIGGIAAGAVLIAFGIGSLVLSVQGKSTVKVSLKQDRRLARHEPGRDRR